MKTITREEFRADPDKWVREADKESIAVLTSKGERCMVISAPTVGMTVQKLAALLYAEFDRDDWGFIDPYLFKVAANPDKYSADLENPDNAQDLEGMHKVLERVLERLRALGEL